MIDLQNTASLYSLSTPKVAVQALPGHNQSQPWQKISQSTLKKLSAKEEDDKIRNAAQDFEAVFVKQLLDAMDKTVERGDMLGGGQAESTFRGLFNDEVAKQMTHSLGGTGFGLAESIYQQMILGLNKQPGSEPNQNSSQTILRTLNASQLPELPNINSGFSTTSPALPGGN